MIHLKLLALFIWIAVFTSSCFTSKETFDDSAILYSIKKADVIRELAEYSVAYTFDKKYKSFQTDTLPDKAIRKKFKRNGQGGFVTVTFGSNNNNDNYGLIDSTVIFEQTTLRGVTEIIYDFAADKRKFENDRSNPQQYVFINVTDRIYYRRRPVPLM